MKTLENLFSGSKFGMALEFVEKVHINKVDSNSYNLKRQLGGKNNIYDFIVDPVTNKSYHILSNNGKYILKRYRRM